MDHTLSYRRSINFKLGRLVLIAAGIGLALVAGLGVWHETGRYTASKREALLAAAQVFGAASSRALAAGDVNAVLQAMRAVGKVPGVVFAMVEDRTGAPVADLGSAVRLEGDLNLDAGQEVSLWRLLSSRTVRSPSRSSMPASPSAASSSSATRTTCSAASATCCSPRSPVPRWRWRSGS